MTLPKKEQFQRKLAANIKAAREAAGLTQEQAGRLTGMGPSQISHYENGVNRPNAQNLSKLARALGTTSDALLAG